MEDDIGFDFDVYDETIEKMQNRFYVDLTKFTDSHLTNRLKYFERMLANRPSEMIYMGNSDAAEDAVESEKAKIEGIELSRSLLKGNSYKAIMKIVKNLEEDPESIRRAVLDYMGKVLVGGANDKAALIINNFWDDFYSTGKPGLVLAVYNTIHKED